MPKNIFLLILILIGLFFPMVWAYGADNPLAQADQFYAGREVLDNCKKAIDLYQDVLADAPDNCEAGWKLARAYYYLGNHTPGDKVAVFASGEAAARQAVAINPKEVEAHFWLGVNMGRQGEERGVLNSLFMIGPIKDEMETILKLDPNYAGAYYTLSVLYRKAPGWPLSIGDSDKALSYAQKAVTLTPAHHLFQLGLAEAYLAKGNPDQAREILNKIINMPLEKEYIPEDKEDIEKARLRLKDIAG